MNGNKSKSESLREASNKDIIELTEAYKEIFKTESLNENLNKLNGNFKKREI